ncbi:hypothetical protein H4N58_02360 [Mumia sp. ZJ1417]|uniref:hypothetical protein n=1 Tax=Mumia sp. ZJ1417 TaxID=2708082 RepID=UPI00141FEBB5|nr:hypothetical protein [Mumia sp. ZJ1417]QMW68601.1 hypothetical protein H4N58_02360 [Mumia sp. ZJ1417]
MSHPPVEPVETHPPVEPVETPAWRGAYRDLPRAVEGVARTFDGGHVLGGPGEQHVDRGRSVVPSGDRVLDGYLPRADDPAFDDAVAPSLIGVESLFEPDVLVEVEAMALID